jgi:magnesium transporter
VATIFIPLTFLAGIYGMNFEYMPELHNRWAYPVIWVAMLAVATVMLVFFWRKGWIGPSRDKSRFESHDET